MDTSLFLNYSTHRKCFLCKEYIILEKQYDEIIFYKKNFNHIGCLQKKLETKKIGKLTSDEISNIIHELKKETEDHTYNIIIKNHLFKYLCLHYNVIMLPTYIFTKMEQIFTGTFRNMNKAIPPQHLLDMFQRRQYQLDKIYHKEKLDGNALINYDLAVLIGKYNNYLDWIERDRKEKTEIVSFLEEKKINISEVTGNIKNNRIQKEKEKIDLLDEDEEN